MKPSDLSIFETTPPKSLPERARNRIRRMSLRGRLFMAFVILIISSASATILIGNAVFNRKVEELVSAKVEMDLKVAEQMLAGRLERMKLVAHALAVRLGESHTVANYQQFFLDEPPLDFILMRRADAIDVLAEEDCGEGKVRPPRHAEQAEPLRRFSPEDRAGFEASGFGVLVRAAQGAGRPVASVLVLDRRATGGLCYADSTGASMLLMALAPTERGDLLVIGRRLNDNDEISLAMHEIISSVGNHKYKTTVFMGDTRISTNVEGAEETQVDAGVARRVLEQGESYVGTANILGEIYFTAYSPIRDLNGRVVGILGIGTSENIYQDIQHRTTLLFSSLIAAGMIFGFIMSFLFSAWLMKPVGELAHGMEKVAQGDLLYKVRINSGAEVMQLAKAFNRMVRTVRERDMKLREMTNEQLSRMEKQVSIGRLAAGVAHEINNPLTAVLSLSSLMLKHLPADDPRREDLGIIVEETHRCREIVNNLLDFARERQPQKKFVDINHILRDTLQLTRKYNKNENIRTVLEPCPTPLIVNGDRRQLIQVFTNLILNATESIEGAGEIQISCDEDSSGAYAEIRVRDTGKGISRENIDRVFEPFFTTKESSKGTGLGLSVTLGIVHRHEGTVEIESEEGKGTTITVILPCVEHDTLF